MLLIKNALIIDPFNKTTSQNDLLISDGRILEIGEILLEGATETIDAAGLVLSPGLMDVHVHFREPGFEYKEDIASGAKAAAKGGFTTVVCMANTKPIIDNAEVFTETKEKMDQANITILSCGAISKGFAGKELTNMAELKSLGAVGFTDDGMPLLNPDFVEKAMTAARSLNTPLSFHEEDPSLIGTMGINDGEVSREMGIKGAPREAEESMVERDCNLALKTGARINIQHISSAGSVEIVRRAKLKGGDIYAEATPQHFSATESLVKSAGTLAKVNPPLRTENDRLAIIEGLKDGTIDFIATDHAPHSSEEKSRPFPEAPSGMIGLETALSLAITHLVKPELLAMEEMLSKLTVNPAKFYNLDLQGIENGAVADFVLFNPNEKYIIDDKFVSKSKNCPFIGEEVYGKVKYTISKGKIVYKE